MLKIYVRWHEWRSVYVATSDDVEISGTAVSDVIELTEEQWQKEQAAEEAFAAWQTFLERKVEEARKKWLETHGV